MQDRDYEWFLSNYDRIFDEYGVSYVAIKDGQILGSYPSYADGVRETMKQHPLGTFIVQFCNGNSSGYTGYIASMGFSRSAQNA